MNLLKYSCVLMPILTINTKEIIRQTTVILNYEAVLKWTVLYI